MNMQEFLAKYGYQIAGLLVGRFIAKAPPFEGDKVLAAEIGIMMAGLESALRSLDRE